MTPSLLILLVEIRGIYTHPMAWVLLRLCGASGMCPTAGHTRGRASAPSLLATSSPALLSHALQHAPARIILLL